MKDLALFSSTCLRRALLSAIFLMAWAHPPLLILLFPLKVGITMRSYVVVERDTLRKGFIAMKFGDEMLDNFLADVLKPCAKQAGFEHLKLDDTPKAGLIDDRLRVEIQSSDFLVADLTHDNPGAYWEAGYAKGLGKPVIYICEKDKFESAKTHFDTNRHLTIIWDKDNLPKAGEDLKATIRATLPQLAKQEDTTA